MKKHRLKNAAASATGMTPTNGFVWPSQVEGVVGIPDPDRKRRMHQFDLNGVLVADAVVIAGLVISIWTGNRALFYAGLAGVWVLVLRVVTSVVILGHRVRRAEEAGVIFSQMASRIAAAVYGQLRVDLGLEPPTTEPERDEAPGD